MSSIEVSANPNTAGPSPYTQLSADRTGRPAPVAGEGAAGQAARPPAVQGSSGLAQLQLANDAGNRAAAQLKSAGDQLGQIGSLLAQMKQQAFQIVKMYPPYPPGDSARVKFLRSINGFRKQIESLIVPPDSKWYGKADVQAQPSTVPAKQPPAQLPPLPELPDTADDAAVRAAVDSMDKAAAAVASQQAALTGGAAGSSEGAVPVDAKVAELKKQAQGDLALAVPGAGDAYQKSMLIKTDLEQLPKTGLSGDQTQLLQAMG